MPPEPDPINRTTTPVQSSWRFFRSERMRRIVLGAAAGFALIVFVYTMIGAFNSKGIDKGPADTGSNTIAQTVPDQSVIVVADKPLATEDRQQDKEKKGERREPPPLPPPVYVVFPTAGASAYFETPPPEKHEDKASRDATTTAANADANTTKVAFKASTLAGGKAGLAMNTAYMMMPQVIPIALDTAMDSTLAGVILAHTTDDVRSPAPYRVLLMPAHTQVVGTYKNDTRNGQHRLFAFAGNAITEEGIPVPLDSQVGDGLGRAGIEGDVDNKYGERFGAAIALTGAQMAASILQAMVSKAGSSTTNLNFGGGGNGVEGLSMEILRAQSEVKAVVSVPPGSVVSLIVDHPIDFSDVIKVRTR